MKKTVAAVTAVAVLAATTFASPYWAVHQMQAAARAGEGDRLAQYVDFPAVRESFKEQFAAAMNKALPEASAKDDPLASMGRQMAGVMMGPMVDAMVTPEAVAMMINRGKAPRQAAPPAAPTGAPAQPGTPSAPEKTPRIAEGYEGLNAFKLSVRDPDTDEEAAAFVLKRDGWLGWKLAAVRLPGLYKLK